MIDASPRRLKVFKTVVDMGGFNVAAQHLGIAQPSVGAHIAALERQAGHSLLRRRRGSRPKLTEAGQAIYDLAEVVLRRSEETAHVLNGLRARQARELVVAAHRDLAASFLPARLRQFSQGNPRVRLVTRIGTIEDVLALVHSGSAQIGILLSSGAFRGAASEVIGTEPLDLVVASSHPLARRKSVEVGTIASFGFITGLRNSRFYKFADRELKAIGLDDYAVALELQEATAVREALRDSRSIACLPRSIVADEIKAGHLAALDLATPLRPLQIRCVYLDKPGPLGARLIAAMKR